MCLKDRHQQPEQRGLVRQLCALYETTNVSEAVRRVIDGMLLVEKAHKLQEFLAEQGGPVDVYGPPPPLPVYLGPDDVVDFDDEVHC